MRALSLIPLVLLAACGSRSAPAEPEPSALIRTAKAATGDIEETVTLYGAAESGSIGKLTLSSPIEAIVQSIEVPTGDNVARGQILVRLTASPAAQADMANIAANAQAAGLAFARAQRLRADGLVSDADVETARAAKQSADAARAGYIARSRSLTLRAAGSGTVEMIGASAGELVAAGSPLVTIVKDSDLRARFGIDPSLARRVPKGSAVAVTAAGSGTPIMLPVLSVDSVVDPQTRLASVYVRIPAESEIGAGESLSGKILLQTLSGGVTVPYAALLDDGGQPFVFVVKDGIAKRRDIAAGPRMTDRINIRTGLKAGEIVAVAGVTALEDGMKVRTK